MVLYTPLSSDDIFPSEETSMQMIEYQGKMMQVSRNENGQFQLIRLLSTNPEDYLNSQFQPGAILQNEYIELMK